MAITRVARQSVADQLFDQLLDGILSGEIAAGSQLPAERELATQAGLNRQAVREALQRLRQMDLVEIVHGGGVHVRDWRSWAGLALLSDLLLREGRAIDPAVARSIMELRASIGADASRLAAVRSSAGTAEALRAIAVEIGEVQDDGEWAQLRLAFWEAIVVAADNIAYRLAYNTLRAVANALTPVLPSALGEEWKQRGDYLALADAIGAGDADAAEAVGKHLLGTGVALVNAFVGTPEAAAYVPGR